MFHMILKCFRENQYIIYIYYAFLYVKPLSTSDIVAPKAAGLFIIPKGSRLYSYTPECVTNPDL